MSSSLNLVELRGDARIRMGIPSDVARSTRLTLARAWSVAFYEHPGSLFHTGCAGAGAELRSDVRIRCRQGQHRFGKGKVNFFCNIGYGDADKLYPRDPRLPFVEAAVVL